MFCLRPGTAIKKLGRDWNAVTDIMAAYFRNDGWKEDSVLKEDMAKYVKQGFHRREMLDFLKKDFAQYA